MNTYRPAKRISDQPGIHAYFDVIPESPDGEMVTWFAFDGKPLTAGKVMLAERDGSYPVEVKGCNGSAHVGARQGWLDEDHIYFSAAGCIYIADRKGKVVDKLAGAIDTIHQGSRRGLTHSACLRGSGGRSPEKKACYRIDIDTGELIELLDLDRAAALLAEHADLTGVPRETLAFKHTKWAPDGRQWIVVLTNEGYRRKVDSSVPRIKVILAADENGDDLRFIDSFGHHPNWMPDSSGIYAFAGPKTVFFWNERGGGKRSMAEPPCEGHPCVSPNLQWMSTDACGYPGKDKAAVVLCGIHSGAVEILAEMDYPVVQWQTGHPPGRVCHPHPVWSPDGGRLYFNAIEGRMPFLYSMAIEF